MSVQTIDEFAKNLSPSDQKCADRTRALRAPRGSKKCLAAAYPEDGRVMRLRELANAIKSLPLSGLVERAADSLEKNGAKVLFASDAAEAREIILGILEAKGAKNVLKIKSMTTEEIGLNEFLGKRGIDAVETDLGELIIQLERERPSHIVKPAIHRTRRDIAKSFENHGIAEYDEDPQHITLAARKYLRKKYFSADAVVSGANYALAKEGALVLATNEGNARFSMAGAKTHIALVGFEKVIPSARELAVFLNLLGRSATAQNSTVYTDFVAGPGKAKNSPEEMYVVFLDNGRSRILGSEFSDILKCIRCGACMNRCPVFRLVGGHGYRAVYPGPLGDSAVSAAGGRQNRGVRRPSKGVLALRRVRRGMPLKNPPPRPDSENARPRQNQVAESRKRHRLQAVERRGVLAESLARRRPPQQACESPAGRLP